jgi:hypothetical protein
MRKAFIEKYFSALLFILLLIAVASPAVAQTSAAAKAIGSSTAKGGFKNEDEIRDKFNNWGSDEQARLWLRTMSYPLAEIESVTASKPHGEKADVEIKVRTRNGESTEGISIKLVSGPNGFNQIDKRWLSHFVKMWKIPADVENALKLFVGEIPPVKPGRAANRMFLNELDAESQKAVVSFFETHKAEIVSDLFQGDGAHAAGWVLVAHKATENTHWALKRVEDVMRFYSDGPVTITSGGNLKIGRITMQRKGGDAGRDTAKMLQFKINPALLIQRQD